MVPQLKLAGNIAPGGSASLYDGVSRIGGRAKAPHDPMPLPVIESDETGLARGQG